MRFTDQASGAQIEAASWIWFEAESNRITSTPYASYLDEQRTGFVSTVSREDAWLTLATLGADLVGLVGGLRPTNEEPAAQLGYLAVDVRQRRRGIGDALMRRAASRATEMGAPTMLLTVHESNHIAQRVYERAGWRPTGRRQTTPIDGEGLLEYVLELRPGVRR